MENRFTGGCSSCSVRVTAGGGFLGKGLDGGWEVRCATCHHVDERAAADDFDREAIELPTVPPPGSATTVALRVLTLSRACWACGKDTAGLIGLYPQRPARGYVGLFTTDNAKTMALVRRLLRQHGHAALAATVKSRYSRTMRERQLSNGCGHCDALQGNFPVHDEAMGRVAASGVDGLDTLLVAGCPVLGWQAIVHDNSGGVVAI
ncbi:hypothetical protein [Streptomyces halstedii]|uniref:Uncharacterized protein n=1 Tax=Streptomyces halstedii TaxID=1944 RepID=A0A6N9TS80_STRHA|nr:hypothetical protein [Streptomyces halstedii]NEA14218.1 hypothetical protein [Streptomyces halstedii]